MKIKKIFQFIGFYLLLVLVGGMFFTACKDTGGTNPFGEDSQDTNSIGDKLSFNMNSIAGLAVSEYAYESRNGISPRSGGGEKLLKIKEDGSIEKFMNVPANAKLSDVSYITKSPDESAKEIYVIFDSTSWWNEEVYDEYGNYLNQKEYRLGQFICVFEDGSYCDILKNGSNLKSLWKNNKNIYQMDFDNRGNVYYIANENTGSSWTDVIYKFNPRTKTSEKLVAAVSDTDYEEFYVSNSGDWIFVKGNRYGYSVASFLRAIPVSDPDNPSNLWYQTNGGSNLSNWIYNEQTRDVYFIVDGMLYKIPYKKGGYDTNNREFIGGRDDYNNGSFSADDIIVYTYSSDYNGKWNEDRYSLAGRASAYDLDLEPYSTKYYYFIESATSKVDYEAIVNYIFARLLANIRNKTEFIEDLGNRFVNYRNDYEIRFDEFAKIEGFEKLATETRDNYGNQLADEELFEAIIEKDLVHLLGKAIYSDRYTKQNIYDAYDNNFFADVLYAKNSNTKINSELFYWEAGAGFDDFYGLEFIQRHYYSYLWKDEFMTEIGNVDATKVLAKFAEACGRNEIDFSLECYKNSGSYSDLYTDLKNEDAILFIDSDSNRVSLLRQAMQGSNYNISEFLSKTCFIKGTDTPAITSGSNSNTVIEWTYLDDLNFADNALYAIDTYNDKLVQLTNSDGVGVCKFVLLDYEHPLKISSIMIYENDFYFRNSIINSIGEETGCHTILKFDPELSEIEDMMWDVPNSENYEITSYSIVGNDLYPCMVRGTNIIIGRIDLSTRFYEKFSDTNAEIKQLLMLK